jgi:hypothetical protein
MPTDFAAVFNALKPILAKYEKELTVKADTPTEYTLLTRTPSPYPQHKGQPMFFASIRLGKAYVSFHLMPLYMCAPLNAKLSPALKKRMQGKSCFNFKVAPEPELITELEHLTAAGIEQWQANHWL